MNCVFNEKINEWVLTESDGTVVAYLSWKAFDAIHAARHEAVIREDLKQHLLETCRDEDDENGETYYIGHKSARLTDHATEILLEAAYDAFVEDIENCGKWADYAEKALSEALVKCREEGFIHG